MILGQSGWPIPRTFPRVFAHRCGGALAPENTLAGLRIAALQGCAAVEFDVMLSADGTPWLIHDETLERTTSGAGLVAETSDAELRRLDAGAYHHPSFSGELLPTLAEAAALCIKLGLLANVEIKPGAGFDAMTGEVVARQVLALWRGHTLPLVSSFSETALLAARRVAPELALGYLWEAPPADWRQRIAEIGASTLHCAADSLSDAVLAEAQEVAIPVLCYTVNDMAKVQGLFQRGVNAVFSDRIDRIASA